MEIIIILLVVGIPLLGIFAFELKKRKIDFKALKSFDFSIVEFFENNLQKISKNNKLSQKLKQKTKQFRKPQKTKKFSGHRNPPPPPSPRPTRPQTRPYVNPAPQKEEISVTTLLEKMRDDFLDNPYIDKFDVDDSDISFKFETGEILKLVDKNYRKELTFINKSKTQDRY